MHEHVRVAIVGAGFAGLAMAARLKQQGDEDFVVLEREREVGGTWEVNDYPGCQCDVPSHLYSLSFEPNPDWSRSFSSRAEIRGYLRQMVRRRGLDPHLRLEHELLSAAWDEQLSLWRLESSQGTLTADVLVAAPGGLSEPKLPSLPGLESFEGAVFHSARWDHDAQLDGSRVAVIGTGASAAQFVPEIQPRVGRLHVFQRTPAWVLPLSDRPIHPAARWLYRRFPLAQRLVRQATYWLHELYVSWLLRPATAVLCERFAKAHLARQVADPELRRKLTPSYRIGCKRILKSNDYYVALQAANAELVTEAIGEVRARSIVTADGEERELDAIVLATGFEVTRPPIATRVRGAGGRSLADAWADGMQAYRGTAIAGFPNMFFLVGPNSGLGHQSLLVMIEAQVEWALRGLRAMARQRIAALEVRAEVQRSYNERLQRRLRRTVWASGCQSWYLDPRTGRNTTMWPGPTWSYRRRMRRFELADFVVTRRPAAAPAPLPTESPVLV